MGSFSADERKMLPGSFSYSPQSWLQFKLLEVCEWELQSYPHFSSQGWATITYQEEEGSEEKGEVADEVLGVGSDQEESSWPSLLSVLVLGLLSAA